MTCNDAELVKFAATCGFIEHTRQRSDGGLIIGDSTLRPTGIAVGKISLTTVMGDAMAPERISVVA